MSASTCPRCHRPLPARKGAEEDPLPSCPACGYAAATPDPDAAAPVTRPPSGQTRASAAGGAAGEGGVTQLLARWEEAYLRGQDLSPDQLCPGRPDLAEELGRAIAVVRSLNSLLGRGPADRADAECRPLARVDGAPDGLPAIPGYEVLQELGRGGMGVVYRARHRGLKREVAVKMISAGWLLSKDGVRRFGAEAELAAALDHPGIIPIYEVGEHAGRPFFAMKLVEGGGLPRHLPRLLADRRAAVRLLAQVARAVHYAHQHGVLHRDLKPANILLDGRGEPVVADFGLAKRLDGGATLSASGAVLGTPSYMAPEQVTDSKGVTTAADVYGLGAILFELLTGRPPFRADGALETLHQVQHDPPPPPRSLNPSVDPVLELVCLKCLEKDPQRRYGSAQALAADLEHWLAGEPVSIRPPSLTALLRAWARQNFGSAGWTVAGGVACGLAVGGYTLLDLLGNKLHPLGAAYESLPSLARPWVAARPVPDWVRDLVEAVMYLLLLPGLLLAITALVRPRNRSADVAAGLMTGLVMAVTFFTVSFGWWSVYSRAVLPAMDDLSLMGETDDALLTRYPDLADIPPSERRAVLLGKAQLDLAAGIPGGILLGMVLAVGISVPGSVALVCCAGSLLRRYGRLRVVALLYAEQAVPGVIFCGYLFLLVQRALLYQTPPQHPVCYLLLLTWCGLAVTAAVRRWPWPTRVGLQAAWLVHYAVTNYWVWYEF
jgi:hypothetical protein